MAYQTYITEAIVCGTFDHLTSDRTYLLFTREAGMLYASAKSVREERSKHRFSLQEFSRARITLVRGKTGWRITGTEPLCNFYTTLTSRDARTSVRDTIRLMRRVIKGEEPHVEIYDEILIGLTAMQKEGGVYGVLTALRMLYLLGYVPREDDILPFITGSYERAYRTITTDNIQVLNSHITRALEESHL